MNEFMKYDFNVPSVLLCAYFQPNSFTTVHRNRKCHGLSMNIGDTKIYRFEDSGIELKVEKNDIVYMPEGSYYTVERTRSGDCFAVNFELAGEVTFLPFVFRPKNPNEFLHLFRQGNIFWKNRTTGYHLRVKAVLYELLALMQKDYDSEYVPSNLGERIAPAVKFIHENYTACTPEIGELAGMCGISEDYFRKIFRKVYRVSPICYINDLKLRYAEELIRGNDCSVTEAAEAAGYVDISHFSREFKKHFGVSPSKYQQVVAIKGEQ